MDLDRGFVVECRDIRKIQRFVFPGSEDDGRPRRRDGLKGLDLLIEKPAQRVGVLYTHLQEEAVVAHHPMDLDHLRDRGQHGCGLAGPGSFTRPYRDKGQEPLIKGRGVQIGVVPADDAGPFQLLDPLEHGRGGEAYLAGNRRGGDASVLQQQPDDALVSVVEHVQWYGNGYPERYRRLHPTIPIHRENALDTIAFDDFLKVDLRLGTITAVDPFPRARNPSWKITIDLGEELGEKRTSAQATNYAPDELVGMQVVCVVNFEPRNIAGFMSEVLLLGVPGEEGAISLLTASRPAVPGGRVY